MSSEHLHHAPRTHQPRFVPGVYNYCDRWCERCRFQTRCRLFRDRQRMEAALNAGLDAAAAAALVNAEDDAEMEEEGPAAPGSERAEFLAIVAAANEEPSAEETARIAEAFDRRHARQKAHPLSVAAEEYAEITDGVTRVLRPMLEASRDPVALAALEAIEHFAWLIAIKTWRATGALVMQPEDADDLHDEEFQLSDANGCAKLVRTIAGESREAWQVLASVGSVAADGVPAAMVRRLEDLAARLAVAFPGAMAFVRPGLDEEGADP
jgi:hypothetical protein